MSSGATLRGSVRWAFNAKAWDPTDQEWLLASRCIQLEEKERIQKFAFKADAKSSMVGRLMMRKFAHLATGDAYDKIIIIRDKNGRPEIKNKPFAIDFNVSHQGKYTVLAGEVGHNATIGVDIMSLEHKTGHQLKEFFRLMHRTFTTDEWNTILSSHLDEKRSAMFFRHWCLKESYTKAIGVGITTDLRRIAFKLGTLSLSQDKPCADTTVEVDGAQDTTWSFHEWLLDPEHCVSVALQSPDMPNIQPVPFTVLTWSELMKGVKPILPSDVRYCEDFMNKKEKAF